MEYSKLIIATLLIVFAIFYDEKKFKLFFKSILHQSKDAQKTLDEIEYDVEKQYAKIELITSKLNVNYEKIIYATNSNDKIKFNKSLNRWTISEDGIEKVLCGIYND